MPLTIITEPNPILHKKAKEIKKEELKSPEIKELILGMKEMVETAGGVGLAAPQVAKSLRLIVIFLDNKKLILINPEITKYSWRKDCAEEGCLSVPGNFGKVKRSKIIKVKALDEEGKNIEFTANNFFARVIQHEVDHLDGILFIDKINT
ncbi:peptide deformylase [Candidatus Falkowbacteria bacterium RIFOXYB2_FULL_38_15]|uniref:Peptide deformylase n=1 Tax=Candidatus Falkowbacteria bacterium RIFOXYA2_FULL_38_12 TaxID=1797993 RepID=A0A1F5S4I0_9BACT|nr:MAG: peptide deformylase [Candidatus Falkowbacteria bacterium RIFOXYA2_FULL_38_12]OGF33732.1 MAG: peptide deformylase [Candidatus Falkowbacteria bacterium RIFOXYB2_FULL_38_15]OGF42399.1 MAG: peptide deformylase [Candidatus Falkowbacteria bacterium RIFOXYD2_FULL_39_16]